MKKYIAVFLSIFISINTQARAAACVGGSERTAFEIQALKNEMMLLAITCEKPELYNQVLTRFQDEFKEQGNVVNQWFAHHWGKSSRTHYDHYITELANQTSDPWRHELEYCDGPKGLVLFTQLQSLRGVPELRAFASLQALSQPTDMQWCKR